MKKENLRTSERLRVKREREKTASGVDKDACAASAHLSTTSSLELSQDFIEGKVNEVRGDFNRRCMERRSLESQWQLNSNFVWGNQFCSIAPGGEIESADRDYFWQEREAYNHIAPIYETRLAKLGRVRPRASVRPSSGDETDIRAAKTASKILSSVSSSLELETLIQRATSWSELCGSSFYKVSWNTSGGKHIGNVGGNDIFEGEVSVDVCSPFEIYPSSLSAESIDELESIIHAKAVPIEEVNRVYGVELQNADDVSVFGLTSFSVGGLGHSSTVSGISKTQAEGSVLVIERYTKPNKDYPNGEFCVVAGGRLLHVGDLPFANGSHGARDLPFIKQDCLKRAGSFFGGSVVERIIPIQRAYNAVKNRKHEFLNRISMGVLAVEDGSVDIDNLDAEGLSPGKILVYRQGGAMPRLLDTGRVPIDFTQEEDRLLGEFMSISGVSEIMRSNMPITNLSGVAIRLLIEQDDTRLSITGEHIRFAIRNIGRQILRLYKQFAGAGRLSRVVGDNGEVELLYWNKSDITCDDVVMETQNEISSTPAVRQSMMFDLINMGLLADENGIMSNASRHKILDALGYGGWEHLRDLESLNINKAAKENLEFYKREPIEVSELDRHDLHILEHTKFGLTAEFERLASKKPEIKEKLLQHIRQHRKFDSINAQMEGAQVL